MKGDVGGAAATGGPWAGTVPACLSSAAPGRGGRVAVEGCLFCGRLGQATWASGCRWAALARPGGAWGGCGRGVIGRRRRRVLGGVQSGDEHWTGR